jgi:flagellar biosynthetic protein FliP
MSVLNRHFARHYLEMVAAMFLGMAVLWMPAKAGLGAAGLSSSELHEDAPALLLGVMAITMTVPMVAWMRYRGHGWRPSAEMSAAMLVPTAGAIALLGAGVVEDLDALMLGEHVAMLLGMLVAMLFRPAEYSGRHTPSGFQAVPDNA